MRTTRLRWGAALAIALVGCGGSGGGGTPAPTPPSTASATPSSTAAPTSTAAAAPHPDSAATPAATAAVPAAAPDKAAAAPKGAPEPAAAKEKLPYLAPEFIVAAHFRPAKILSAPLVKKVVGLLPTPEAEGPIGAAFPPGARRELAVVMKKFEQWKGLEEVWIYIDPSPMGRAPIGFAAYIRAKGPLPVERFLEDWMDSRNTECVDREVDGRKVWAVPSTKETMGSEFCLHQVDPRTLLAGPEAVLKKSFAAEPGGPLSAVAAKQSFAGPFTVIAVPGPFKPLLAQAKAMLDEQTLVAPYGKLPELIPHFESAVLKASLEGPELLVLEVALDDEAAGAKLKETLDEVWTEGKMIVGMGAQQAKGLLGAKAEGVVKEFREKVSVAASAKGATLTVGLPTTLEGAIDDAVAVALPKLRAAAEKAQRTNNLKQIALAFHNYEANFRKFPADKVDADGKPLVSWRTLILPQIDEGALYDKLDPKAAWDSEVNKPLLEKMPAVFAVPGAKPGHTSVFVFKGKHTAFPEPGKGTTFSQIRDGSSNSILLIVAKPERAVPWTQPSDLDFDPEKMAELIEALPEKDVLVGMFDGAVFVWKELPKAEVLKALITVDVGEAPPQVE